MHHRYEPTTGQTPNELEVYRPSGTEIDHKSALVVSGARLIISEVWGHEDAPDSYVNNAINNLWPGDFYIAQGASPDIAICAAIMERRNTSPPRIHLSSLAVQRSLQGNGYGRWFLNELVSIARSGGAKTFALDSTRKSVGFYTKMGFDVEEEYTGHVPLFAATLSL